MDDTGASCELPGPFSNSLESPIGASEIDCETSSDVGFSSSETAGVCVYDSVNAARVQNVLVA